MTSQGELATVITTVHPIFRPKTAVECRQKFDEQMRQNPHDDEEHFKAWTALRLFAVQNSRFQNMSKVLPCQRFVPLKFCLVKGLPC